ncbi:unnamed protein product, partial [Musa hybrid cultivar]
MKPIRVMLPLVCGPPIRGDVSHANCPVTGSFSILLSSFHRFDSASLRRSDLQETTPWVWGSGFGPGSGERWRRKQSPRLRDQHRLGKVLPPLPFYNCAGSRDRSSTQIKTGICTYR